MAFVSVASRHDYLMTEMIINYKPAVGRGPP